MSLLDPNGNQIETHFLTTPNRLQDIFPGNWQLLFSDADYHRTFIDKDAMRILTYVEGDVCIITCKTKKALKTEIDSIAAFMSH